MDVEIDISENLKRIDKDSFLGASTKDETYQISIHMPASVKKRIKNYPKLREKIHAALIYALVLDELPNYTSIKICPDVSRNSLHNNLLSLFKDNASYTALLRRGVVSFSPVGHGKHGVDRYVKKLKKGKLVATKRMNIHGLYALLRKFRSVSEEDLKER